MLLPFINNVASSFRGFLQPTIPLFRIRLRILAVRSIVIFSGYLLAQFPQDLVVAYGVLVVGLEVTKGTYREGQKVLKQVDVIELAVHDLQMALHVSLLAKGQATLRAGKWFLARVPFQMVADIGRLLEGPVATRELAVELSVHTGRLRIPDVGDLVEVSRDPFKFFIYEFLRLVDQGLCFPVHPVIVQDLVSLSQFLGHILLLQRGLGRADLDDYLSRGSALSGCTCENI